MPRSSVRVDRLCRAASDDPEVVTHLVLVDTIVYDSFPEPGIARLKDPVWDRILGAADFDLKRGLTKGFTRGMVHAERITPEMIATYERPFQGASRADLPICERPAMAMS